jgi:hypothetical protein
MHSMHPRLHVASTTSVVHISFFLCWLQLQVLPGDPSYYEDYSYNDTSPSTKTFSTSLSPPPPRASSSAALSPLANCQACLASAAGLNATQLPQPGGPLR